jgi:hypothetical protein
MREDMYKVIVERPRRGKQGDASADRRRRDLDGPLRLGMRAGYGYRSLNENLAPLRRYLRAQVARPWSKVFSEICDGIDRRNTVQQHIHQHIRDFIAIDVDVRDGRLVDLADRWGFRSRDGAISQELYVDPRSGLIRLNKGYSSWRRTVAERKQREQAEIDSRRRIIDERAQLLRLNEVWFRVEVAPLPEKRVVEVTVDGALRKRTTADSRFDVVMRRSTSLAAQADGQERARLYGSHEIYAASKRQLSRQELKAHGLR